MNAMKKLLIKQLKLLKSLEFIFKVGNTYSNVQDALSHLICNKLFCVNFTIFTI